MNKAIIVADDSTIVKNVIEKNLKDKYKVLKASNGKEAVQQIINSKDEIIGIFLDLSMPDVDGFVVLDHFKKHKLFKRYPVVIISGDDTKDTIERAFTYNIVDMLNKPFNSTNIQTMVDKMITFKNSN